MNDSRTYHSLQTYVSDMIALEKHIAVPLRTQREDSDVQKFPEAQLLVDRTLSLVESHIGALTSQLESLGGHEAAGVKEAVSMAAGAVAGAIDKSRRTEVSKNLRDDYTALSDAAISYTMLYTTALAMQQTGVASLAEAHLNDYTKCIIEISRIIPSVVVRELADMGIAVDTSAISQATERTQSTWNTN